MCFVIILKLFMALVHWAHRICENKVVCLFTEFSVKWPKSVSVIRLKAVCSFELCWGDVVYLET